MIPSCRTAVRAPAALAAAALAAGLAVATPGAAGAAPVAETPRGMPAYVHDVLVPGDPGFWVPGAPGTRVLTGVPEGAHVVCSSGFTPPVSCSLMRRSGLPAQVPMDFVDVPALGRVWIDVSPWGSAARVAPRPEANGSVTS